jgi:RTX calcium-binding nonapeptide repeat (4 copies)
MRGSLRAGGAALVLAGLLALIALLSAVDSSSAGHRDGPRERLVKCRYSPDTQTLSVRLKPPDLSGLRRALRRLPAALREEILGIAFPSSAALDVRIGQITVLEGEDLLYGGSGGLIRCAGGPPTVTNTDTVVVRAGKRVAEGYLFLDFRYGLLTPGATDEGDGSSEIELEVDLDGGEVFGRMTRGPDQVSMDFVDGRTAVNLNAGESVDDTDLRVGARDAFFVQGAGSGDQLYVDQTSPKTKFFQAIDGGQGEDLVQGGSGPNVLSGGFGSDVVEAGAGRDFVFAYGGSDQIDCGPGRDTVLVHGKRHELRDCERKQGRADFDKQKRRKAKAAPKVAGAKVVPPLLRRKTKRFR